MVDAMIFVQLVDVEFSLLDQVEIGNHDPGQGTHETRVPRKERKQTSRVLDYVPRGTDDAKDRDDDSCAEDIDVLWVEAGYVIAERVRSCRYLVANSCEHEGESSEEFSGSTVKIFDHCRHVPLKISPDVAVGRSNEDGSQSAQRPYYRECKKLVISGKAVLRESSKIRHVDGH